MNIKILQTVSSGSSLAVGAKIRNIRKAQKKTLQEVAAAVGTDTGNLSRMERGQQGIGLQMMFKLGEALECSPDIFWRDVDDQNGYQRGVSISERLPNAEVSFERANQASYKLSETEARLVDNFRDLEAEQANVVAQQVHEQAELARAKRLIEEKRAVRYMNDPRVQALLAEIEQKEKK